MDATEIQISIASAQQRRDRLVAQRATKWDAAETYRGQACEPRQSSLARRELRFKEIAARAACQHIDNQLWAVDVELRRLKSERDSIEAASDVAADHNEFFNRVRQIVATSNVVPLPVASNEPEVA